LKPFQQVTVSNIFFFFTFRFSDRPQAQVGLPPSRADRRFRRVSLHDVHQVRSRSAATARSEETDGHLQQGNSQR